MTATDAYEQITKGITDFDNGIITRASLDTIVEQTVEQLAQTHFHSGMAFAEDEAEEDVVEVILEKPVPEITQRIGRTSARIGHNVFMTLFVQTNTSGEHGRGTVESAEVWASFYKNDQLRADDWITNALLVTIPSSEVDDNDALSAANRFIELLLKELNS